MHMASVIKPEILQGKKKKFTQNKRVWLELFPNGAPILNPPSSMSVKR